MTSSEPRFDEARTRSLPTRPPAAAARRSRPALLLAALALKVAFALAGVVTATAAWHLVLPVSAVHARDGGDGGGGDDGGGDRGGDDGNDGHGDDGGDDGHGDDGGDDGGDNSGKGGDNSGKGSDNSGKGSDDGKGEDSGGRGKGDDDGRAEKGKSRTVVDKFLETLKGRGKVVWASTRGGTIEVRYSDGWSERVGKDGYSLLDPRHNVVVRRPAKPTDFERLRAAARR
jgi:hypothetical protein